MRTKPKKITPDTGTKTVVREVEDVLDDYPYQLRTHKKNPDKIKIAHLYSLYLQGYSLAYIAKHFYKGQFTRQALFDLFKARGYTLRKKTLKPVKVYKGIEYRQDSDGLYRSRKHGKTVYLHRLLWEEAHGTIPDGHYVIFKDGNKENIILDNLRCIASEEAKKLYNYGNQYGFKRFQDKGAFGTTIRKRILPRNIETLLYIFLHAVTSSSASLQARYRSRFFSLQFTLVRRKKVWQYISFCL